MAATRVAQVGNPVEGCPRRKLWNSARHFVLANGGTVFTFCPLTDRAKLWIDENVETEGWQWLGATLVVETRFAYSLAVGMTDAGLILK